MAHRIESMLAEINSGTLAVVPGGDAMVSTDGNRCGELIRQPTTGLYSSASEQCAGWVEQRETIKAIEKPMTMAAAA